jgi:transcription elongation factor Elf1
MIMVETVELETFDLVFSFHCPKCDYLNEEISANDLLSGNAECGMCETEFKVEGLDTIKLTATIE